MSPQLKILHTSDLHLGKKLFGFSLKEDQEHILNEILDIAKENKVDALVIAGDIYDVPQPPEDAVRLFSDFLLKASKICSVYAIAGNHDSAERIGYARELLSDSRVYLTGRYSGKAEKYVLREGVNIFLLPYMRTSSARHWYDDETINNPDKAMKVTLDNSEIDPKEINIIVAHQFIAGHGADLEQCDSEQIRLTVGTDSIIHSDLFDAFDYGAFGHIHKPQLAGRKELQYCGSPLKYSESEYKDEKHVNLVTIKDKNDVEIEHIPLHPLRDMVRLKGSFDEVYEQAKNLPKGRQVYVVLTENAPKASERLGAVCDTLFHIGYELPHTKNSREITVRELETLSDTELFERFFREMTGKELSEEQKKIIGEIMEGEE